MARGRAVDPNRFTKHANITLAICPDMIGMPTNVFLYIALLERRDGTARVFMNDLRTHLDITQSTLRRHVNTLLDHGALESVSQETSSEIGFIQTFKVIGCRHDIRTRFMQGRRPGMRLTPVENSEED